MRPHPHRSTAATAAAAAVAVATLAALAALGAMGAVAAACRPAIDPNGRDPLASLASPEPSAVWDLPFWVGQATARSRLWRRALDLCGRHAASPGTTAPNCRTVRLATWWTAPPPPPPAPQTPLAPVLVQVTATAGPPPPAPAAPAPREKP